MSTAKTPCRRSALSVSCPRRERRGFRSTCSGLWAVQRLSPHAIGIHLGPDAPTIVGTRVRRAGLARAGGTAGVHTRCDRTAAQARDAFGFCLAVSGLRIRTPRGDDHQADGDDDAEHANSASCKQTHHPLPGDCWGLSSLLYPARGGCNADAADQAAAFRIGRRRFRGEVDGLRDGGGTDP